MTNVDGYWLPRHDQDKLIELLDQIPDLVEDLTIAITRQDRISSGGPRTRNGSDEQPIPIGLHALEAADLLHHTLTAWTNHVCEQRNYPRPRNDTLTLGRWLKQHIIALALTEGAEESLDEIQHAIRQARRATDRPAEQLRPELDQKEMAEADRMVLNASAAARLAKSVGYHDLTTRRIKYLRESGRITPVHTAGRTVVFLFGDIRKAHQQCVEDEQPVAS